MHDGGHATSPPTTPPAPPPVPKPRVTICPYCGSRSRADGRCEACRGQFDPLSRQATQNAMGPWFIRDEASPHRPGCSYQTIVHLVTRGKISPDTVIRGPTTLQFWTLARWCPGVAHLLGACHSCQSPTDGVASECSRCGASFRVATERQYLGLGDVRYVPGRGGGSGGGATDGPRASPPPVAAPLEAPARSPEPPADVEFDARLGRAARELARARRWRTVWAVGFVLLACGWLALLLVPTLDIDAGPVGRWLHGAKVDPGTVGPPDLSAEPTTQIRAPGEIGASGKGLPPASAAPERNENQGAAADAGALAPTAAPTPSQAPDPAAMGGAEEPEAFRRLRKLR